MSVWCCLAPCWNTFLVHYYVSEPHIGHGWTKQKGSEWNHSWVAFLSECLCVSVSFEYALWQLDLLLRCQLSLSTRTATENLLQTYRADVGKLGPGDIRGPNFRKMMRICVDVWYVEQISLAVQIVCQHLMIYRGFVESIRTSSSCCFCLLQWRTAYIKKRGEKKTWCEKKKNFVCLCVSRNTSLWAQCSSP